MSATEVSPPQQSNKTLRTVIITVLVTLTLAIAIYWLFTRYLFPSHFNPVELSKQETVQLNQKLRSVNLPPLGSNTAAANLPVSSQMPQLSQRHQPAPNTSHSEIVDGRLIPEAYSETNAKREIRFSERELNAILGHNTELADKLAIDLSDNLISVKWLLPLDPEFPLLGGKTLKFTAGVEVAYRDQQPSISLRGLSLWGVPLPSAWMGDIKQVDLVTEYSGPNQNQQGFWHAFAEGIDYLEVNDSELLIKLKK